MTRSVGIDLGTTNSVVAVLEGGQPTVVASAEGNRTVPSIVAFTREGKTLVGDLAKRQAVTNVERTVRSIKRHMGTSWALDLDGKHLNAQQISSFVLAKLKRDAEAYLGETVTDAVITVPAYFSDAQRQATKEAGELAGLRVARIVNEPTAAALTYGLDKASVFQTILVYDLGGGTFDVSLLEIGDDIVEVRATAGNNRLGGDDWDARVVSWLHQRFTEKTGVDLSEDKVAGQRLQEAAEAAKIALSGVEETLISLPYLTQSPAGPLHLEETLTRSMFEELTADLLAATRKPVEQVLADAGVTVEDVDQLVLVGGSTRMPAVADLVTQMLGRAPHQGVNPDEVVALGAALQAGVLSGEVSDILLLDVTPLSLGIETKGGAMATLIERNTTIPTKRTEVFTTAADNQSLVEVKVAQGERAMWRENQALGTFELSGIEPAERGVPRIEVTFDIDTDGIVHVYARDTASGSEKSMTVTGGSALPASEIDRMLADAEQFAAQDATALRLLELRNQADALLYDTTRLLVSTKALADEPAIAQLASSSELVKQALANPRVTVSALEDALSDLETSMAAAYTLSTQPQPVADGAVEPTKAS